MRLLTPLAAGALLSLAAAVAPGMAVAADPVAQAEWPAWKQEVELPNGQALAFVDLGPRDAPVVVLIHGFTDNSRSWSLPAPYLMDDFRLIIPDLRGHGASEAPECCYAVSDLAYDVRLLLDTLHIDKADIVGHSLGSIVAQLFAEEYPDRVRKLVLVSSTSSTGTVGGPGSWLWDSIEGLEEPIDPNSQFMLDWYANPNPVDPDFIDRERAESAAVPLRVWRGVVRELATNEFGRRLPELKAPVLILWGGQDGFFGEADQTVLRAALPAAQFSPHPTLGHNLFWEDPEGVAGEIAAFLKE